METRAAEYTRVTALDRRAARDAFPVVAAMHALAAELAAASDGADVDAMRRENERFAEALRAGDVDEAIAADDAFHDVFVTRFRERGDPARAGPVMPRVRRLERLASARWRAAVRSSSTPRSSRRGRERRRRRWSSRTGSRSAP